MGIFQNLVQIFSIFEDPSDFLDVASGSSVTTFPNFNELLNIGGIDFDLRLSLGVECFIIERLVA